MGRSYHGGKLPRIKTPRGWTDLDEPVYDDISSRAVDGAVIRVRNEDGDTLLLKKHELSDVLEGILNKLIEDKDIDLYKKVNSGLMKHIDENTKMLTDDSLKYYSDKIDKVAEDIAISMLDSEIEKQIRFRVEAKLEEMRKLL